jgi:hypothetical protein
VTGLFGVNRPFQALRQFRETPDLAAQITAGRQGACPEVRSDSIEARENTHSGEKIKRFVTGARHLFNMSLSPNRRRLVSDRALGSQPGRPAPGPCPGTSGAWPIPSLRRRGRPASHEAPEREIDNSKHGDFLGVFRDLRLCEAVGRRPVPSGGGYLLAGRRRVNQFAQRISRNDGMSQDRSLGR